MSIRRFVDRAARAPGTVVRFRAPAGPEVEFQGRLSSRPAGYGVGDSVTVLSEPGVPDRAEIEGFWSLWLPPISRGLLGTVVLTAGVFALLVPRGTSPPGEPGDADVGPGSWRAARFWHPSRALVTDLGLTHRSGPGVRGGWTLPGMAR